jgi:hypothetical protein
MNATVSICDDIRMEINGKLILIGMYTGNIIISTDNVAVPQMVFLFYVDCKVDEVPRVLEFEATLPGGEPQTSRVDITEPPHFKPEHTRWYLRHAITLGMPHLSAGKIKARVRLDDKEIELTTPWIEVATPPEEVTSASSLPAEQSESVPLA